MSSRIRSVVALATLALAAPVAIATNVAPAAAAPIPREGFSDVLVASGLGQTTAFAELPDERMFVTSKGGDLWLLAANGTKPASPALTLSPCTSSEQGLVGVAVHPSFAQNNYFFLFYTRNTGSGCVNTVSRFTLNGATVDPGSELRLIDNIPSTAGNHNGGDVQVGKDGNLYVSTGDNANESNAPLTTNLMGKILRIGLDGSIPGSNPLVGASGSVSCRLGAPGTGPCQEIVARGLRNPFRIAPDVTAAGTEFYIMDVGDATAEEIDEYVVGADYGWPVREGFCARGSRTNCNPQPPQYQPPVFDYGRENNCRSITGGAFVPSGWPTPYAGGFLYADFVCQKIFALIPDGQGGFTNQTFVDSAGSVTHLRSVQRGGVWTVYYATLSGELHRITSDLPPNSTARSMFHPITPTRVLDTRVGTGYTGRKPAAGDTITLKVTGGDTGVPADAVAVALNLTGTEATAAGFVTLWPAGEARPTTSAVNLAAANDTTANAVIARLGVGGQVNLFTQTGAHLVADVTGYWTPTNSSNAGRYVPAPNPLRLLDTRAGLGASAGIVGRGGSLDVQVTGVGGANGVPSSGIEAVALVVTVVDTAASGFVTVWPTGQARPLASTVNPVGAGDIRANLVMLPIGANGKVSLYTKEATHLVVDVAGWFTDGTADLSSSGLMVAVSPFRVTDTRNNVPFGRLNGGDIGILDYSTLASGAVAIATNLTVDATQSAGFLTAWPAQQTRPVASNLNWSGANQTRAALAISSLADEGEVAYFPNVGTHFIVDVSAYFVG